jgi:hypothetical protein
MTELKIIGGRAAPDRAGREPDSFTAAFMALEPDIHDLRQERYYKLWDSAQKHEAA